MSSPSSRVAERAILEFLEKHQRICFENTLSRPYARRILEKLRSVADVRLIGIHAPFETTLERIATRDPRDHVRWSPADLHRIFDACEAVDLPFEARIDNIRGLADRDLVEALEPVVGARTWYEDHVEIRFRGKSLLFDCWSGDALTAYDVDYQPWRVSFTAEIPQYLRHVRLGAGDVVVDAGAYKGTFTAYAAKVVGDSGRVIAFEPDVKNFQDLQRTVELNELTNVTLLNKALWSSRRTLKFNGKHTAGASVFFNASPHMIEVPGVTLDDELAALGVDHVDFLKMDIEGSEVAALEGSRATLTRHPVRTAIATYHVVGGEETAASVERILESLGYEATMEIPSHKITYARRGNERR